MADWIALVVVAVALSALSWWNARLPDDTPGAELARRYQERGGPSGGDLPL